MDAIEKRARELLAAEIERDGFTHAAEWIRDPSKSLRHIEAEAIRAIIAALTPPEGYVLVPAEPTEAMKVAGSMWNTEMDEPPEFSALMSIWKDMLAARPEVKP